MRWRGTALLGLALLSTLAGSFSSPGAGVTRPTVSPAQVRPCLQLQRKRSGAGAGAKQQQQAPQRGVVSPTARFRARETQAVPAEEESEMTIRELLAEYGLIALLFHFSVWISCLAAVFALFSFGLDVDSVLPDWLSGAGGEPDAAGAAAGVAGKAAATLAVVEAVGPARLALTVAATPKVSERARTFKVVRDLEAAVMEASAKVFGTSSSGA